MPRSAFLFVWASSLLVITIGFALLYRRQIFSYSDWPPVETIPAQDQEKVLGPAVREGANFQSLVVFGDSLSDTGRLRHLSLGLYMPPQFYWKGRITNGPVWVDYASHALGLECRSLAVGGAASRESGEWTDFFVPSLLKQVESYVQETQPETVRETVAVIQIGGNNYLSNLVPDVQSSMTDIEMAANRLALLPFKAIVLSSMPNLAGLPPNPEKPRFYNDKQLEALSIEHNRSLRDLRARLQSKHSERVFFLFDIDTINRETLSEKERFGLPILDRPCYPGNYLGDVRPGVQICQNVYQHRYWDWVHPNSKVHCFWAIRFLQDLHEHNLIPSMDSELAYAACISLQSQR
jgi:thermolabile hemolysin